VLNNIPMLGFSWIAPLSVADGDPRSFSVGLTTPAALVAMDVTAADILVALLAIQEPTELRELRRATLRRGWLCCTLR
jgi:hypothetical protein